MPDKHLYEYAIVRVVPRVEREEFINVGVILYSRSNRFLGCLFGLKDERLKALCGDVDCNEVRAHLHSFAAICAGEKGESPISTLDAASRFRWLTATRSTIVQCSKVHPGFCLSPQATLQNLFDSLVA